MTMYNHSPIHNLLSFGNVTFFPYQNFGDDPKLALDALRNIGLQIVEQVNELNREAANEKEPDASRAVRRKETFM